MGLFQSPAFNAVAAGLMVICTAIALVVLLYDHLEPYAASIPHYRFGDHSTGPHRPPAKDGHPIKYMMRDALKKEQQVKTMALSNFHDAAQAYRKRRGRHPPPRYNELFDWAASRNVTIIEEFFDDMMDSIDLLWGVEPHVLREFASTWDNIISIRNGTLKRWKDEQPLAWWMQRWDHGLRGLPLDRLPDVDLAFLLGDEPVMYVPDRVKKEARLKSEHSKHTKFDAASDEAGSRDFSPLPALSDLFEPNAAAFKAWFDGKPGSADENIWPLIQDACPSNSGAKGAPAVTDYSLTLNFTSMFSGFMLNGFIANWDLARNICHNPTMREIHGTFVNMHVTDNKERVRPIIRQIVPLLAGCRIRGVGSEILVPPSVQWPFLSGDSFEFDDSDRREWDRKDDQVFWRGDMSGGVNKADTWTRFHRHRFVAMMNGSLVYDQLQAAKNETPLHAPGGHPFAPWNFPLPDNQLYDIGLYTDEALRDWVDKIGNVSSRNIYCEDEFHWYFSRTSCEYDDMFYKIDGETTPAAAQFEHKYLPDVDGASYSGRFNAFLRSNSVPIKATIWDEWHDNRLIPWRHFVPMDVSNRDLWGILQYFIGFGDDHPAHDKAGQTIGAAGSEWASQHLRLEDQEVYMYRLILELARVQDEKRDDMGYTDDLRAPEE